jgi:hypothetical protein
MHHQQPQQPLSAPAHMAAAVGATGPFNGFGGDTAHLFSHLRSSEDGLAPVAGLGASFSAGGARPAPPPAQLPLQQPQQQAAAAEPAMPGLARLQLPVIGRGGDVSSCSGDEDSSWAEPAGRAGFASMAVDSRAATPATPGTPGTPMLGKNGIALPSGLLSCCWPEELWGQGGLWVCGVGEGFCGVREGLRGRGGVGGPGRF